MAILGPNDFAALISFHKTEIIAGFLGISRSVIPAAVTVSTEFLKDHLPEVVDALIAFLRSHGGQPARIEIIKLADGHGRLRGHNDQYSITQLQTEFAIIRNLIMKLLGDQETLNNETVQIFAEFCELTLSGTASGYLSARNQILNYGPR